ncbi:butyrophilin-like protein 1 [Neolamprologus brichardi]|uniref:butyrophilin-like protein 1 n=1 Tax=Neolamprologus brichardi TaxID=32507 RepID=UPI001643CEFA|nr:butyrophilin-like protein 1 [Neolamprologus brichardi]
MTHLARHLLYFITSQTVFSVDTLTEVIVEEGSAVVLPCALSSKQDITNVLFDWKKGSQEVFMYDGGDHYNNGRPGQDKQFKDRVSHLEEELKHGNASIRINNTRVSDSGNYTCLFPRLNPPRTFSVQLVVSPSYMDRLAENILGASMTPYTAILNVTEDGVTLRCEVPGVFPKPKLEWQDSDGNVLPAEEPQVLEKRGRYYVSLRSTVSRTTTNLFVCVARQEDIHHQTKAEIYVPEKIFEECKVLDHGWSVVLGILIGAVGTLLTIGAIGTCQRDSDRCGPYTAVLSLSTCSKCGETVDKSGPNSRDAPTPGPAEHTTHLSESTERGPTDSLQREPQTAELVNLSQCGETSDKGATNGHAVHETNTNITQKSAGKLKHLKTQEKSGTEGAEEIGSNGEIKLDVELDDRD